MADVTLDLNQPVSLNNEEEAETLSDIDRGIQAANEGRVVSLDEARKMIPQWISKFKSQNQR